MNFIKISKSLKFWYLTIVIRKFFNELYSLFLKFHHCQKQYAVTKCKPKINHLYVKRNSSNQTLIPKSIKIHRKTDMDWLNFMRSCAWYYRTISYLSYITNSFSNKRPVKHKCEMQRNIALILWALTLGCVVNDDNVQISITEWHEEFPHSKNCSKFYGYSGQQLQFYDR